MDDIKTKIRESRDQEVLKALDNYIQALKEEGLDVEFGNIGNHTTWALIYDTSRDIEIVGYTYLIDLKYYREGVGKLKALQQALVRKHIADEKQKDTQWEK